MENSNKDHIIDSNNKDYYGVEPSNEVKISPKKVKNNIESLTSFFSIAYAIILTLSVSYNVGYFKQINPHVIDIMTIGDFINDSVHHVWFFLFAGVLFFISSLASLKKKIGNEYFPILIFGIFALILCSYLFINGSNNIGYTSSAFKEILNNSKMNKISIIAIILAISFIIYLAYIIICLFYKKAVPAYIVSITPIVLFIMLVALPYLSGSLNGYIELKYYKIEDYTRLRADVVTVTSSEINDIVIVKTIDKGIIYRNFNTSKSNIDNLDFGFINMGAIMTIEYK
jgi:hypothetical protein